MKFDNKNGKKLKSLTNTDFIIVLLVLWNLICFTGCDYCIDEGDGDKGTTNEIYFTAIPINQELPCIYESSENGLKLELIIKNGIIYSPASESGILAYVRNTSQGSEIRTADLDGKNDQRVISHLIVDEGSVSYPVLSPDGKYILFIGGRNTLYITDKSSANRISLFFTDGTLPSFSKDGKHFAFFENVGSNGGVRIRVFVTETKKELYNREYESGIKNLNGTARIDWSTDGRTIAYSLRNSADDVIYLDDIMTGDQRLFAIDSSTGAEMPAISPKNDAIAFVSRNGDIFIRNLSLQSPEFIQITEINDLEINRYPEWSPDGTKLIYNNYYILDDQRYGASLILVNKLGKNERFREPMIISSNNVFRGYFY